MRNKSSPVVTNGLKFFAKDKIKEELIIIPEDCLLGNSRENLENTSEFKGDRDRAEKVKVYNEASIVEELKKQKENDTLTFTARNVYLDINFQYLNSHDIPGNKRGIEIHCSRLVLLSDSVINLSGKQGEGYDSNKRGADGYPGMNITIKVENLVEDNGKKLRLVVNGGTGAKGGKGNVGKPGGPGENGTNDMSKYKENSCGPDELVCVIPGKKAGKGQRGGQGGKGGDGGNGGKGGCISVYLPGEGYSFLIHQSLGGSPGKAGEPGEPGEPGVGGKQGTRYKFIPAKIINAGGMGPGIFIPARSEVEKLSDKEKLGPRGDKAPGGEFGESGSPGSDGTYIQGDYSNFTAALLRPRL